MNKIEYKAEFLDILRDLSIIVPGILLYKENDNLFCIRKSANDIYYTLETSIDNLNFDGDYFAIREFGEFFSLIKTLVKPEFFDLESHILVKDTNAQLKYPLTTEDYYVQEINKLKKKDGSWKIPKYPEAPDFKFTINNLVIKEIKQMSGKIGNEFITLNLKENMLYLNCFKGNEYPSWQKSYKSEIDSSEEFGFKIYTDIFNFLPNGIFEFNVYKDGLIRLTLNNEEIKLNIFAAEAGG